MSIVEERVRNFQAQLALTLQSFELRQNTELFRVPRELRGMTLKQVQESWGGTLGGTVARIKQEQLQAQERERIAQEEEERRVREQEAKNKRWVYRTQRGAMVRSTDKLKEVGRGESKSWTIKER